MFWKFMYFFPTLTLNSSDAKFPVFEVFGIFCDLSLLNRPFLPSYEGTWWPQKMNDLHRTYKRRWKSLIQVTTGFLLDQVPLRFKPCNLSYVVKFKVGMIVSVRYTNKNCIYFWAKIMSSTSQGFKVRWIDDDPRNLLHPSHHVKALPGSTESTLSADITQHKANSLWNLRRSKYQWL